MPIFIVGAADEANNLDALHLRDADGNANLLCTDLLINGAPWNQSLSLDYPYGGCQEHCPPIGSFGTQSPIIGEPHCLTCRLQGT